MKKTLNLVIFVTIVSVQFFLLSVNVMAQAYGENAYGSGVYNDTSSKQPSDPDSSVSNITTNTGQNPDLTTAADDDAAEQPAPAADDKEDAAGSGSVTGDSPTGGQENGEDSSKNSTFMKWISVGAIALALLLAVFALIARKRRQE